MIIFKEICFLIKIISRLTQESSVNLLGQPHYKNYKMIRLTDLPRILFLFSLLLIFLTILTYGLPHIGPPFQGLSLPYKTFYRNDLSSSSLNILTLVSLILFYGLHRQGTPFGTIFIVMVSFLLPAIGIFLIFLPFYLEDNRLLTIGGACITFLKLSLIPVFFFALSNQYFSSKQVKGVYALFFIIKTIVLFLLFPLFDFFITKKSQKIYYFFSGIFSLFSLPCIIYLITRLENFNVFKNPEIEKKKGKTQIWIKYLGYLSLFIFSYALAKSTISYLSTQTLVLTFTTLEEQVDFIKSSLKIAYLGTGVAMFLGTLLFLWIRWIHLALTLPLLFIIAGSAGYYLYHYPSLLNLWFALDLPISHIKLYLVRFFEISLFSLSPVFFLLMKEVIYMSLPWRLKTQSKVSFDLFLPLVASAAHIFLVSFPTLDLSKENLIYGFSWIILIFCGFISLWAVIKVHKLKTQQLSQF